MIETNVKEEKNRGTCSRARKREIEKARKRIGGESGRQAGRHRERGCKQARTRGRWFRSTRKVYGTQRCEITSRKHARLRHPNGYETCVCAHILRVSSPIATEYWYHSAELRLTNLTRRAIVFDRILEIYNIVQYRCNFLTRVLP